MRELLVDESLSLLPVEAADTETLYRLADGDRAHLRRWLPWVDACTAPEVTRAFQERNRLLREQGSAALFVLVSSGDYLGTVGFNTVEAMNRAGTIGYWLSSAVEGRGVMFRALGRVLEFGFEELDLHRVVLAAAVGNSRSRNLAARLGFQEEGIARDAELLDGRFVDHAIYALLRADWNSRRPAVTAQ